MQEMLAIVEPRGEGLHRSIALWVGGLIAWLRGDLRQAAAQVVESLRLKRAWASDDRYGTALCLEVLAWITADQQRHRRAATLLGAADTLWTDIGTPITSSGTWSATTTRANGRPATPSATPRSPTPSTTARP